MNLYLENLTLASIISIIRKRILRDYSRNEEQFIFFIDASIAGKIFAEIIKIMNKVKFQQLKFKVMFTYM